jgi:cell division septation protein DedD
MPHDVMAMLRRALRARPRRLLPLLASVFAIASFLCPPLMQAQDSSAATGAAAARTQVLRRAQRLVNDGSGAEGRALVDSLLNATEPRSPEEAEVLYWRAMLAESWDQAQRDYLRVMLEHERSRFAASAMLRLAQGEAMRGDREAALRYAERLLSEAADAPERADALALRAQLTPAVPATSTASAPPSATPGAAPRVTPPATVAPGTAPSRPATPSAAMVWTVQIAAFPTAEEAATFAALIRERGYETRVDGIAAPFRVRFGRYPTRAAAAAAMEAYKTNERAEAFLTQVPR